MTSAGPLSRIVPFVEVATSGKQTLTGDSRFVPVADLEVLGKRLSRPGGRQ